MITKNFLDKFNLITMKLFLMNGKVEELDYYYYILNSTDFRILQRLRETTLKIDFTINENDYFELESVREYCVTKIREIQ